MREYDCVVLGSGIAGSACALLLARCGLQVLVVEKGAHPRFAIGESMVPTSTLSFDALATAYDVPELRQVSHYPELRSLGLRAWPKLAFYFAHHQPGRPLQRQHQMMFRSPGLPVGPDVHMLRSDVDAFLASRLEAYGVEHRERTRVTGLDSGAAGVVLDLASPAGSLAIRTRFVVDCSGHASFLAQRSGLRDERARCRTDTRAIFGHFREIPALRDLLGEAAPVYASHVDAGTIHHCFDGGWIWVIRFDDGNVSVGAVLDRRKHPDDGRPAEEELFTLLERYPTVREHLGAAVAVRPPVKTGRIQFTSRTIIGDRFLLSPHAAAFIDPLFSTGVDLTLAFLARAVPEIRRAMAADDFHPRRFAALDRTFHREIRTVDLIVSGMLAAFRDFEQFKQYWRTWVYGSAVQYFTQICYEASGPGVALGQYGAGVPRWRRRLDTMARIVGAAGGEGEVRGAELLKQQMDGVSEPFGATDWSIGSDREVVLQEDRPLPQWFVELAAREPALGRRLDLSRLSTFRQREAERMQDLTDRYRRSRREGSSFHRGVDLIRSGGRPLERPT